MTRRSGFLVAGALLAGLGVYMLRSPPASPPSVPASTPSAAPSGGVVVVGGHAVGPANAIAKLAQASARGTVTACESPPPDEAARSRWKVHEGALAKVPFADLLRRSDSDLTSEVVERLLDKIYGVGWVAMSREEQNVELISALEAEVVNGGLDQYFTNSSGNCAVRAAVALREIGFVAEFATFQRVLAGFPDASPSEDRSTRFDQLDAIGGLHIRPEVDKAFDGLTSSPVVAAYVKKHAIAFNLPPN